MKKLFLLTILFSFCIFIFINKVNAASTLLNVSVVNTTINVPKGADIDEYKKVELKGTYKGVEIKKEDYVITYGVLGTSIKSITTSYVSSYTIKAKAVVDNLQSKAIFFKVVFKVYDPSIQTYYFKDEYELSLNETTSVEKLFLGLRNVELITPKKIDTSKLNSFEIVIEYENEFYEKVSKTIKIKVLDTTAPIIRQTKILSVKQSEELNIEGYFEVLDDSKDKLTNLIEVVSFDKSVVGKALLVLKVADYSGNEVISKFYVNVIDDILPELHFYVNEIYINEDEKFNEKLFLSYISEVKDNVSNLRLFDVKVDYSNVSSVPNNYYVTYSVKDYSGNLATYKLNVIVKPIYGPVFDVENFSVKYGSSINEADIRRHITYDLSNATINNSLTINYDTLNTQVAGEYIVTVKVYNSNGISTTKELVITVLNKEETKENTKLLKYAPFLLILLLPLAFTGVYFYKKHKIKKEIELSND